MKISESAKEIITNFAESINVICCIVAAVLAFCFGISFSDEPNRYIIASIYAAISLVVVAHVGSLLIIELRKYFIYKCT